MPRRQIKKLRSKNKLNFGARHTICIFKSNAHIYAQVQAPDTRKCVFTASSLKLNSGTKTEKATQVGKSIAEYLKENKIDKVNFYRNGFIYTGRVKVIADAIRSENISI